MIGEITKSPLKAMELLESFKSPNNWTTTRNALRHLYDFSNEITNEEEMLLGIKLDFFNIGINFLELNFGELNFDFSHVPSNILVDDTPTHLKDKDLKIAQWNLLEEAQVCNLNLGTKAEPKIVKINNDLDLVIAAQIEQLLKEYHDGFCLEIQGFQGYCSSHCSTEN
jgi:hypothetical protein